MVKLKCGSFPELLVAAGLQPGATLMLHGSFRAIRRAFPALTIEEMIQDIQARITPSGSLIIPAFTYCFKKRDGSHEIFDPGTSSSKVGAISETFWRMHDVVRTHAPTHSFALWGRVRTSGGWDSAPVSPLGAHSVLGWLARQPNARILLLGVSFAALTFGHYLEVMAPVPWADFSPWDHLGVEKTGVSITGEMQLCEVPGCARSFRRLETHLLQSQKLASLHAGALRVLSIPVHLLLDAGLAYVRRHPLRFLCDAGNCPPCDARRQAFATAL